MVEAEIPERNPLNVEVEFVPSTFRNPCRVEVPPVKAWMVEVEVRPTYRASRAAIPLPIKSPVKVEVPKERDGAVTERNPAKVEVAPRLVTERLVRVVVPSVALVVATRFGVKILLEKKLVVVAAVPVAEVKVRPWRVETPATARVPVKLAAEEMVCPLMSPVVKAAKVEAPATFKVPPIEVLPVVRVVEKRLVELAVPAKLVVEVALVVVLLSPVKLARVEEALETKPLLKYQERFVVSVVLAV